MNIEQYLNTPYPVGFAYDDEGDDGWFVKIIGLPGCMSQGDSFEEACVMIEEAATLWFEVALEDGDDIPDPNPKAYHYTAWVAVVPLPYVRRIARVYQEKYAPEEVAA